MMGSGGLPHSGADVAAARGSAMPACRTRARRWTRKRRHDLVRMAGPSYHL